MSKKTLFILAAIAAVAYVAFSKSEEQRSGLFTGGNCPPGAIC